jgi:glycosyltransferase involved in cell wall biosynthesis
VRLLHVTTVPQALFFLRGQPGFMRAHGMEVHAVSSPGPELEQFARDENVEVHAVEMRRAISPIRDLGAIAHLVRLLRQLRPDIVHAHTPKGGLLGMAAAALARVPVRIYHLHCLPMVTSRGVRRALLQLADRASCQLAHRVLCVSGSMRDLAVAEGLVKPGRIEVPGHGSINGVDAEKRFRPGPESAAAGRAERARWGIPEDALVIGFVGRVVRDKGITELADAWKGLRESIPAAHLLIVGAVELEDPLPPGLLDALRADPRVHLTGLRWDTPPLFAAMDVVVLPSYREGFGVVLLEGAAMGLPVVGTDIPGGREALVDGVTGLLVPARDAGALESALSRYLRDPDQRRRHGSAGRERALRDFRPADLWVALLAVYQAEAARAGLRWPEHPPHHGEPS